MKVLLVAINAKYIHSNLAVYSLQKYAQKKRDIKDEILIKEYTINQFESDILRDIYMEKAELVVFSCYIWNIEYVLHIGAELKKVAPCVKIWAGGPEVSYDAKDMLEKYSFFDLIMCGEGEETFSRLLSGEEKSQIPGIAYRKSRDIEAERECAKIERERTEAKRAGSEAERGSIKAESARSEAERKKVEAGRERIEAKRADSKAEQGSIKAENAGSEKKVEAKRESKAERENIEANRTSTDTERETMEREIVENPQSGCIDMDTLPFVYDDLQRFEHKILYYETSRGCPFSCSYCLSSIDKTVRFRSLSLVKKELSFFLENKVKQVKFVDRTFNCKKKHAMEIWMYLREQDNGVTNFHFEVSADLFDEEELSLLSTLRPGLIQLEIGVQSTNAKTIEAIRRKMDLEKLKKNVMKIHKMKNMHQHLDLIAGLPYEDYETFQKSFDDIYRMRPQQLQLGFLKVLKGSYMHEMAKEYGLVYQSRPVYEVYRTNWISYDEILRLKGVEEMVEVYYNSNQFTYALPYLQQEYDSPFSFFLHLADYYERKNLNNRNHTRIARYEILMDFAFEKWKEEREEFKEILLYDLYLRENLKSRPAWATDISKERKSYLNFFKSEQEVRSYLWIEGEYDSKKAARKYHIEPFWIDIPKLCLKGERVQKKQHILFDYDNKNPLTGEARTIKVECR